MPTQSLAWGDALGALGLGGTTGSSPSPHSQLLPSSCVKAQGPWHSPPPGSGAKRDLRGLSSGSPLSKQSPSSCFSLVVPYWVGVRVSWE